MQGNVEGCFSQRVSLNIAEELINYVVYVKTNDRVGTLVASGCQRGKEEHVCLLFLNFLGPVRHFIATSIAG